MTGTLSPGAARRRGRYTKASRSRAAGPWLHVRARGAPVLAAGLAVVVVLAWLASDWLVHREWLGGADARIPVVAAAPLLGAVLVASGLGAADEALERAAAVPWRRIRTLHIVVVSLVLAVALAATGLWEPRTYGAFELVRNALGYVGLIAGGAVMLGSRLAWAPAFGYASVVYLAAPKPLRPGTAWWTWPLQPWSASLAAWTAGVLFLGGLVLYARFGARAGSHAEPA